MKIAKIVLNTVKSSLKAAKRLEYLNKELKMAKIIKKRGNQVFSPKMTKIMKNPQFVLFSMLLHIRNSRYNLYSEWEHYMCQPENYRDYNMEHYKEVYIFFYNLPTNPAYELFEDEMG